MNELRVENLKASCSLQDLDKVFRVFKPKKIEMYLNEQKKSTSVIFESVKEAETCFEIINVRQDLIERAIGKAHILRNTHELRGGQQRRSTKVYHYPNYAFDDELVHTHLEFF